MKTKKTGPELRLVDEHKGRYAVVVDGLVTYCGAQEECRRRLDLLSRPDYGREEQDRFLQRACQVALLLLALLLPFGGAAAGPVEDCRVQLPLGAPSGIGLNFTDPVCHPEAYIAWADPALKLPRLVAYTLTGAHTLGCLPRASGFHAEALLPLAARAVPADYDGSHYDLGHQMPAQDAAWDPTASHDSFSMVNVAPQIGGLNRQAWERLEEATRAWAVDRGELVVMVGPILSDAPLRIGKGQVAVPDAFWKVVADPKTGEALAFRMSQQSIPKGDMRPWQTTIAAIEAETGLTLPGTGTAAKAPLWPFDLSAWHAKHKAACPSS